MCSIAGDAQPASFASLAQRAGPAGDRVMAVGQRGHVLYSDDAGGAGQQAEVPVSSDLVAVSFPSAPRAGPSATTA